MANDNNLTPFNSETGAEAGKIGGANKKGSKHLSTLIREIGENIDWDKTTLKDKESLRLKYGNNGWQAVVYVAVTKGLAGDLKALDWLAKYGYGQKLTIETDPDEKLKQDRYGGFLDGGASLVSDDSETTET